jgi:hypothetical protein
VRGAGVGILVVVLPGCLHHGREPLNSYSAAPTRPPPGPAYPSCQDQPVQSGGIVTGDLVTCEGNYTVTYPVLRQAGLAQAARYALSLRRTHILSIGETNHATQGQLSGVDCKTFETEKSRKRRMWHAIGESIARDTSTTHANCSGSGNSFDCTATTYGATAHSPPPPVNTDTTCTGGIAIPGTEGHVLQLSIVFLNSDEAASSPLAQSAQVVLYAKPEATSEGPRTQGTATAAPSMRPSDDDVAPFSGP